MVLLDAFTNDAFVGALAAGSDRRLFGDDDAEEQRGSRSSSIVGDYFLPFAACSIIFATACGCET